MSALRTTRPAQTMSSDLAKVAAPEATAPVAEAAPISAAAAAKAVPATTRAIVPAKTNAKGDVLRCGVLVGKTQCSNPGRHAHGRSWTCSTHDRSIAKGRKVTFVKALSATYVAPVSPSALAKAAAAKA